MLLIPKPPEALLSVEEAVHIAVRDNPRYAASIGDISAAWAGVRSARALINPTLVVSPRITSASGSSDELLFQQPLELGGTRNARTGIARAQLTAAQAQASVELRDLIFRTQSAYYELVRARERAAVARDTLAASQDFDRIARRQVDAGTRPGLDLAQTGIEVSRAHRLTTLASADEEIAAAVLNTQMARAPNVPVGTVTVNESLSGPSPEPLPAIEYETARALASRAEIQVERAEGERFRGEARLALAEGHPDLAPQFRVGSFTRGLPGAAGGNGAGVGIGITLPVLDYGGRRNRIRQAEAAAAAQARRVTATQNNIRREVAEARARLLAAETVVSDYQNGVLDQSKRLLDGSRTGFDAGRTSVIALLDAQRSYRAVRLEYVDAQVDAALARAAMERAIGSAVPHGLTPSMP